MPKGERSKVGSESVQSNLKEIVWIRNGKRENDVRKLQARAACRAGRDKSQRRSYRNAELRAA